MAVATMYNARVIVAGEDLSDHCKVVRVSRGQESRDATAHGNTARNFRAGLGTHSMEATFFNDRSSATAAGSVESVLRGLVSITSTGFAVSARALNSATTTVNPDYQLDAAVLDGDLMVLDSSIGELEEITARFVPYSGSIVISTSAS